MSQATTFDIKDSTGGGIRVGGCHSKGVLILVNVCHSHLTMNLAHDLF